MLKPHAFCKQPSISLGSPQASIPPLAFPSEDSNVHSLPLSYNFHPLSWFPHPITLLVTEGSKHVQLVKLIPGPLSRLQLEFSARKSFLKIDLFAEFILCIFSRLQTCALLLTSPLQFFSGFSLVTLYSKVTWGTY